MQRSRVLGLIAGVGLVLVGQAAFAQSATINAARFGIYENFGIFSHSPDTGSLPRYDVGQTTPGVEARDYFTFNLSSVNFTVTGATLRIYSPNTPNTDSPGQTNTLNIRALSTSLTTITDSPEGTGAYGGIFADLGDGTLYGTTTLTASAINNTTIVDIPLTGALTDINAAGTGAFGVGGSLVIPQNINSALYFTGGTRAPFAQLVLTGRGGTTSAPEPGTFGLALAALPALGLLLRRRR